MAVGLSEPAALVMFLGGLVVSHIAQWTGFLMEDFIGKGRARPKGLARSVILGSLAGPQKESHQSAFLLLIFLMYAYLFVDRYAEWRSDKIIAGDGDTVMMIPGSENQNAQSLLGSTSNFVIVYDHGDNKARVISIESIEEMVFIDKIEESTDKEHNND